MTLRSRVLCFAAAHQSAKACPMRYVPTAEQSVRTNTCGALLREIYPAHKHSPQRATSHLQQGWDSQMSNGARLPTTAPCDEINCEACPRRASWPQNQ